MSCIGHEDLVVSSYLRVLIEVQVFNQSNKGHVCGKMNSTYKSLPMYVFFHIIIAKFLDHNMNCIAHDYLCLLDLVRHACHFKIPNVQPP